MAVATNLKIDKEDFEKKLIEMQTALDGMTATEMDFIDGAVAGTGAASKAVVLDSGEDFIWPAAGVLTYGGTAVTANGAELNMAADSSANLEIVTTTNVLLAAESGKTLVLNNTAGFLTTLPVMASGLRFRIVMGAGVLSSSNHTLVTNVADTNKIYGSTVGAGVVTAYAGVDTMTFVEAKFIIGDYVDFFCDGTYWYISGISATEAAVTGA